MRTEDLLATILTGLWQWGHATGIIELDAEAARLLGLPAEPVGVTEGVVRSRVHPVDWNEFGAVASLALAEDTIAEARLRVMDEKGQVVRTIRSRAKPMSDEAGMRLVGTLQQVAEPHPGSAAQTPVTGDWRRSREAFLLDAGRALAEARSTAEVLRVAASLSMPGFSPDGLAVFGVTGDRLTMIGQHGYHPDDEDLFSEMPLDADYPAAEVVRTGRAVYLSTPEEYRTRFPATWSSVRHLGRESWAFLPLIVAGRTMGAWMAAFTHRVGFTPDERSVLTTVARMLAQALARAGVAESERELSLGLQRTMMPILGPAIPGMEVAARYVPTGGGLQVGGDWYDMIQLPGGRAAFVIGDVQGHDVRAAGLMGQLRIALRAYASEGHRPDAVLSRASRFLHGITEGGGGGGDADGARFATCLYLEVDPATGTLDIARAGHPDPAVLMPDGTVIIQPTDGGLPLGIVPDTDYPTTRMTLEPGETLMVCTDGLLETGGHDLETGWLRIRRLLEEHHSYRTLEGLADSLVEAVHGPGSHHTTGPLADRREDDIAVLLLSRSGGPTGRLAPPRRMTLTVAQVEPERIAGARQLLRELLHDWTDGDQVDSAVLMVSEMVTNVLLHTDGDARLVAEARGEHGRRRLRVEVADASDELPHRRRPGEMASSGRGLMLMEVLAHSWGVDPRGEGKSIWFELHEDGAPNTGW
ncbi:MULTISPECIES: ATP-binding SpoIIE family protein phosphatase [Streptomyces]|uniref:SpoIIE family protein phosphatase n=1 Tax=Streptomyces sudanensis TaxID=436397 RepID=A0ABY4TII6_9ACTN|nr:MULTISPECIES: SpoIIE family protein phosphatase [Streptomyces]MCP9958277.1 SpoIIE family protein phosphatase [Streptomyces sudanensis]MCP9987404.1 SpoIIE family protein phosphatase [Streptomyces sudanensis]MCQ0001202.1 SpoIIE family protein phosphatase [Streptomyces sudanensis]URN16795.1 SpoIIE family protein phosphatase [Streptomyces sudanensis]